MTTTTPNFATVPEDIYAAILVIESEVDKWQLKMIRDMLAMEEESQASEPTIITLSEADDESNS